MENEEKNTLRQRLAMRYGASGLSSRELIILRGRCGATVYGCRRILHYSPREIRLDAGKTGVSVAGERLYCASFTGGTVNVEGRVELVRYFSLSESEQDQRKGNEK